MDRARPRLSPILVAGLVVVPALFLGLFFLWPLVTVLVRGLGEGSPWDVLADGRTWRIVWFTTLQAAISTAVTVALGLPAAQVVARYRFRGRQALLGLVTAVFVLPTVVVGAAVLALAPPGWERGLPAIVAAHVVFNLAVVIRLVGTTWEQLPAPLEWAAATLGASPWRTFRWVTWPLLRETVVGAAAVVFVFSFTSFGVVRLLGTASTRTVEVEIWRQATQLGRLDVATTLTVLQLLVLAVVLGATGWRRRPTGTVLGRPDVERRSPHGRGRAWVAGVAGLTAAIVGAPLVAMTVRSLRGTDGWSLAAWQTLDEVEVRPGIRLGVDPLAALGRSLTTAVWATLIAVVVGGLAVLAIDAARRGGRVLDAGILLPLGTSAVTVGLGMLITFDAAPVDWRAEWWLVPVGHALIAVPFVVRSALGVLRTIPADLHHAAATLGAGPTRAWLDVTVRRLRRPLAQGAALAAAVSLGEFGATSFLSRTGGETAPLAIERLLSRTGDLVRAQGFALATILAALTVVVVSLAGLDDLVGRRAVGRAVGHRPRAARGATAPEGADAPGTT